MSHVAKATSKGQITLPAKWRKNFDTDRFLIKENGNALIITALDVDVLQEDEWETIFDAKRDTKGKGIPINKFMKALKKTL